MDDLIPGIIAIAIGIFGAIYEKRKAKNLHRNPVVDNDNRKVWSQINEPDIDYESDDFVSYDFIPKSSGMDIPAFRNNAPVDIVVSQPEKATPVQPVQPVQSAQPVQPAQPVLPSDDNYEVHKALGPNHDWRKAIIASEILKTKF